jgi:hypothetical protein
MNDKFKVGQKLIWITDNMLEGYYEYKGTVKAVFDDHIIVDIPELNDHCWFEERDLDDLKIIE